MKSIIDRAETLLMAFQRRPELTVGKSSFIIKLTAWDDVQSNARWADKLIEMFDLRISLIEPEDTSLGVLMELTNWTESASNVVCTFIQEYFKQNIKICEGGSMIEDPVRMYRMNSMTDRTRLTA